MVPERDPYEVLGIQRGATKAQIRHAYRRLAKRYHPDVNAGDGAAAERFKEVQRAYEALTDERPHLTSRPTAPAYRFTMPGEHPFFHFWAAYTEYSRRMAQRAAEEEGTEPSP